MTHGFASAGIASWAPLGGAIRWDRLWPIIPIWASRFLQISLALPQPPGAAIGAARAIPVDRQHAASPRKPSRRADAQQGENWRAVSVASALSRRGAERITCLRHGFDPFAGGARRPLLVCADATFTNRTVLQNLAPRTTLIGRIRKDARLSALPTAEEENQGRGRRRCYGQRLPTPEQGRRDESLPWQRVRAFAAGNVHGFQIKFITPLRWKHAGGHRQLSLLEVSRGTFLKRFDTRKGASLTLRTASCTMRWGG